MKLNTGALHIFARPILYNGVQYIPGDRVPPSVPVNKLRVLVAAKHVSVGSIPTIPINKLALDNWPTPAVEEKTPILREFEAQANSLKAKKK